MTKLDGFEAFQTLCPVFFHPLETKKVKKKEATFYSGVP
jgi:hypothetical protein